MEQVNLYLKESYQELVNNVTWPKFSTLIESTIVVIVTSTILALLIFTMDAIFKALTDLIYP